ncbi:hypothetical protein F5Y04DRAFT_276815 [Hypomontagnella monticulosa]|nr:hypothetical protein F5Y04DRAFT_276815 [Hypomontagnella monticulosa]
MPLNGDLKPSSLYIALDSRPLENEYHWALVTTNNTCHATLRHASNLNGPWRREEKDFDPDQRMMLIALVRVSDINSSYDAIVRAIQAIPANGLPSSRTGREFNCLTWVLDTIVDLADQGMITLPYDINALEGTARKLAARFATAAETGGGATVLNDPFSNEWVS